MSDDQTTPAVGDQLPPTADNDISALPDRAPVSDGDGSTIPGDDITVLPGEPPDTRLPDCPPGEPPPGDDELRMALERARLIAAELESTLQPAAQALRDGAWESRSADEFSLELEDSIRQCGTIAGRGVEAIEELIQRGGRPGDGDLIETLPHAPIEIVPYDDGYRS